MRTHHCFLAAAVLALPAQAQTPGYEGFSRLGQALGEQDSNEAYMRGVERAADVAIARANAQRAMSLARSAEMDADIRERLRRVWLAYGLPDAEATAVAGTYRFEEEQQAALVARVSRTGWESGVRDALAAYQAYNYLLANQLILAAQVAKVRQDAADKAATEADAAAAAADQRR